MNANDTTAYTTALANLVAVAGSIGAAIEAVHMDLDGDHDTDEIAAAMANIRATASIVDGAPYYSDSIADDVLDDLAALDIADIITMVESGAELDTDELSDRITDTAHAMTEADAARILTALADGPAFDTVRELLADNTDLELDLFND